MNSNLKEEKIDLKYYYFIPRFIASDVPIILNRNPISEVENLICDYLIAASRLFEIFAASPLPLDQHVQYSFPF